MPDRETTATGADPTRVEGLRAAFADRRAVVGVIGLGYVGLPLALAAAKAGFRVLGFDVDAPRVATHIAWPPHSRSRALAGLIRTAVSLAPRPPDRDDVHRAASTRPMVTS